MISISQQRTKQDTSLTRRHFLNTASVGLGSLALCPLALNAPAATGTKTERSVILLMLVGGPSQLETWDPKPDAPMNVRGPFQSIATRCPGVRISEHLPLLATRMDRIALVRSVHHDAAPIHETGYQLLQTGRLCRAGDVHPHFGSVVARLDGPTPTGFSQFALVPNRIATTGIDIPHGQSAGWLGAAHEPSELTVADRDARDPGHETPAVFARYGETAFGRSCLRARRLVERGTRVVTVNMFDTVFNRVTWDCHGSSPFSALDDYAREVLPTFDRAFAALIDDLEQSGRLETTLVVAAGEFGRTPRINSAGGRDHWPGVWSVALAGGGVRGGQVVGASDGHAASPADRPVTPQDLLATIYHGLGIDPAQYLARPDGETFRLVEDGRPIRELFV